MPYWQLFYHFVWATKARAPLITGDVEPQIHRLLRQKALDLQAVVFAINGMPDHVHIVAAVPPKVAIAAFVGQIKAVAATKFNRTAAAPLHLAWQNEYGVFSFDSKRLPNYVSYVERQKEHHQANSMIRVLESTDGAGPRVMREPEALYQLDGEQWRRDLDSVMDQTL